MHVQRGFRLRSLGNCGGNFIVDGITINGAAAGFRLVGYSYDASHDYRYFATIAGPVVSNAPTWMEVGATTVTTYVAPHIYQTNVSLSKANSLIKGTNGTHIAEWDFNGSGTGRTITDTGPVPQTGLKGDVYTDGVDTWDCTVSGYLQGTTYHNATWVKR